MSYDKNTWAKGDVITASKLNNIESGVAEVNMSYDKTTWQSGDVITAVKLNNIEDGIANASGGSSLLEPMTITLNITNQTIGTGTEQGISIEVYGTQDEDTGAIKAVLEDEGAYYLELQKSYKTTNTIKCQIASNGSFYLYYTGNTAVAIDSIDGAIELDQDTNYIVSGSCTLNITISDVPH